MTAGGFVLSSINRSTKLGVLVKLSEIIFNFGIAILR